MSTTEQIEDFRRREIHEVGAMLSENARGALLAGYSLADAIAWAEREEQRESARLSDRCDAHRNVRLVNDVCPRCHVHHGDPCPCCGRRGYHQLGCELVGAAL
jgi:translation initiation factor 6 (eIF-6)